MIEFDFELVPPAFGFNNVGGTCYFNSLIQCLLTCTSLSKVILANINKINYRENKTINIYADIIRQYKSGAQPVPSHIANKAGELWRAMMVQLKNKNKKFGSGQEDSHEAFMMLMHCWEDLCEVNKLLTHIYHNNYLCNSCHKYKFSLAEMHAADYTKATGWISTNNSFMIPYNIDDLANYLMIQGGVHTNIKCDNCGSMSDKLSSGHLAVIPEILVVNIKKYTYTPAKQKKINYNTRIPYIMQFPAENGKIHKYIIVAQIIHTGGLHGGHYWAQAIRKDSGGAIWCNLNDNSARKMPNKMIFGPNTYTVFYHKVN